MEMVGTARTDELERRIMGLEAGARAPAPLHPPVEAQLAAATSAGEEYQRQAEQGRAECDGLRHSSAALDHALQAAREALAGAREELASPAPARSQKWQKAEEQHADLRARAGPRRLRARGFARMGGAARQLAGEEQQRWRASQLWQARLAREADRASAWAEEAERNASIAEEQAREKRPPTLSLFDHFRGRRGRPRELRAAEARLQEL
eukprot:gene9597-17247_t